MTKPSMAGFGGHKYAHRRRPLGRGAGRWTAGLEEQPGHCPVQLEALEARVRAGGVSEVILATNPTVAGDGTGLYIASMLESLPMPVRVTRLARGLPAGGQIEYASKSILADAINERRNL